MNADINRDLKKLADGLCERRASRALHQFLPARSDRRPVAHAEYVNKNCEEFLVAAFVALGQGFVSFRRGLEVCRRSPKNLC
jgi:hypothetical protein